MHSLRPFLPTTPEWQERVPRLHLSPLMLLRSDCPVGFSQTRNSLCSRPLRACSHLENRELSHFCIAHCVWWVAWLYQKTSLVLSRWMRQASSTGLPEAFTCPATLDRPGRLGARSLHGQARSTGLCVQVARNLHSSNRFRLARSTGLFETLSLESLTRFLGLCLWSL